MKIRKYAWAAKAAVWTAGVAGIIGAAAHRNLVMAVACLFAVWATNDWAD